MSNAEYAISGIGVSGMMVSGWVQDKLLVQIGKYYVPAVSGIGVSGLMVSGLTTQGTALEVVEQSSFSIEQAVGQSPTASFTIVTTPEQAPHDGDPVVIAIGTLQNRLFGGYLVKPTLTSFTLERQRYACTAVGWARDVERRLAEGSWSGVYAGEIVRDLIATYAPHLVTAGYVEPGVYLEEEYAADFRTPLSICQALAERSGYIFYIDPLRQVHFRPAAVQESPWNVETGARFGPPTIEVDSSQLVNHVIVRYSELFPVTESFPGDGETPDFDLAYVPHQVESLTVNGNTVGFGSHYQEDNSQQDFSIEYTRGVINTRAHDTLTADDTLTIAYTAKIPARLDRHHRASQRDRAEKEGGDGIYDLLIEDRAILSKADARSRADAELEANAWPHVRASYVRTERMFELLAQMLRPGMRQRVTYWNVDETLTIEKVSLTALNSVNDYRLTFLQSVQLGPQPKALPTVLDEMTATPETSVTGDERTYEEDYDGEI